MDDQYTAQSFTLGPPPVPVPGGALMPSTPKAPAVLAPPNSTINSTSPASTSDIAPRQNLQLGAPSTVHMKFDDGTEGDIPQAHVSAAVKDGGKITTHMYFDDNTEGWISLDKVHDAMQDGGALGYLPPPKAPPQPGVITNDVGNPVVVPQTNESFSDTVKRAIDLQKQREAAGTQQQAIDAETRTIPAKAAQTLLAAPAIGLGGAALLAAPGEVPGSVNAAKVAIQRTLGPIVQAHPWLSRIIADAAIHEARKIPYIGGHIPPGAEMLPWFMGGLGLPGAAAGVAESEGAGMLDRIKGASAEPAFKLEPPSGQTPPEPDRQLPLDLQPSAPEVPTAPAAPPEATAATPKAVQSQLNSALGNKPLVPGVSLRNQPAAQAAAQAAELPQGFTPVESSALKGYKYSPSTREFETVMPNGQRLVYGDVRPSEVEAFENAPSKGNAFGRMKGTLVAKVVNGQRVNLRPTGMLDRIKSAGK